MLTSMLNPEFIVEPYCSGVRIDTFLSRHLRNYTAWRLHRLVTHGLARIDGLPAEGHDRVFVGQRVSVQLVEPPDKLLTPFDLPLEIVYEDPWIVVVDKPAGVVAHPVGDFQEETLANALQEHVNRQSVVRGLIRPGVVHRLDRMTSGLIVVAKEHYAHRLLSIDFQQGRLSKAYLALIEGHPAWDSRMIDLPIGQRPGGNSVLMSARHGALDARPARTRVTLVQRFESHCCVECVLYTGRNHQIRVHLAELGHPVVGDEFYGPYGAIRKAPRLSGGEPTGQRHALHAAKLSFLHPILRQWISLESTPPPDFWQTAVRIPSSDAPEPAGNVAAESDE